MDREYEDNVPCCRIEFEELEFLDLKEPSPTGAFGEIRFAKLRGVEVAVKKIKKQMTQRELDKVRFEVDILTQLRHPNVNLFMGICYDNEGKLLIISERLKEDMEVVLRRIRRNLHAQCPELAGQVVIPTEPPLSERMCWAKDAVKGLNWLHRNPSPVVHRDIKPANMLFDNHGTVKVCDFGLSRFEEEIQEEQNPVGTPIYMAPEILDQDRTYEERTDVYAFAITLWEIVTCLDALRQQGYKTMPQLKQAVQRRMQRPPIPEDAPASLRNLLERCWAAVPANRPTFAEILNDMEVVIEECKEAECRQKIYEAAGGDIVASTLWFDVAGSADEIPWSQFKEAFERFYSLHLMGNASPTAQELIDPLEYVLSEDRPGNQTVVTLKRWGEAIGWFGPMDAQGTNPPPQFLTRVHELLTQGYFHGHATARRAAETLSAPPKTEGAYLVRFSASSYGCFVISALHGAQCANYTVQRHEGKYYLPNGEPYNSISELLANESVSLGLSCHVKSKLSFGSLSFAYGAPAPRPVE